MINKKKMTAGILTSAMCISLFSFTGCTKVTPTPVAATEQAATVATVPAPVASAPILAHEEEAGILMSWELDSKVWSSSNGATVTLKAQPREYTKGQAASFVVTLNGEDFENKSCDWDGNYYTASVDLEAADGYQFECVMFPAQGAGEHFALSDAYNSLVYLKTSLNAYSNLFISDFKLEDGKFIVTAGYASVQLPQLSPEGSKITLDKAELVFELNAEPIETQKIDLPQGEGTGSHEASLNAISFTMPQMDDDYQLDLVLNVTLSNGEQLPSANGGSWFYSNGELRMSAG